MNEAELRALWSAPGTRKKLLQGLAERGFGRDQPAEMQKIIDAGDSDLFDVADLGAAEQIASVFAGFQRYLYEPRAAA